MFIIKTRAGADPGGSLRSGDSPFHNTSGKQKECVAIKINKNVLYLVILAALKESNQYFLKVCTSP